MLSCSEWIDLAIVIFTLLTVVATFLTALANFKSARAAERSASLSRENIDILKMQSDIEMRPILGISSWCAGERSDKDIEKGEYPAYLFFTNLGRSYAQVMAVELNDKDITAHIGLPLNIGSGQKTHVKIWLPCKNKEVPIMLSLYYWDIENRCFRTELFIYLTWILGLTEEKEVFCVLDARVEKENIYSIGKIEKPNEVRQWPKDTYLYPPWWN